LVGFKKKEGMNIKREIYKKLCRKLAGVLYSERGQTLVEYGLLLVLIAVIVILMVRGTGRETNSIWSRINSGINQ